MTPERLLRRLRDAGFQVRIDDAYVLVSPAELLTSSLTDRIRARKSELLDCDALLRGDKGVGREAGMQITKQILEPEEAES